MEIESQEILQIFREHEGSLLCSQHTVPRCLESEYISPCLWINSHQTENRSSEIVNLKIIYNFMSHTNVSYDDIVLINSTVIYPIIY